MAKIKDWISVLEEPYLEYEEWLNFRRIQVLSESEINEMEEEFNNPSTVSNFIVSNVSLNQSANNANYNPSKGA